MVAAITSYNFPLVNMAGKIGPALAMGNTLVVKPAPQDPLAIVTLAAIGDHSRATWSLFFSHIPVTLRSLPRSPRLYRLTVLSIDRR